VILVLLASIAIGIVVTSPQVPTNSGPLPTATSAADVLREGVVGSITTLDPLYATNPAEHDADALLFRGLTRLGDDGTAEPDLAASWTNSADGRTWTFQLRDDVTWDDGEPITADDVTFTFLTLKHPDYDGPLIHAWSDAAVERLGRFEVRFTLGTALASFLTAATQPIVPAHVLAGTPVASRRTAAFGTAPVGSGPFRLAGLGKDVAHLVRVGTPPAGGQPALLPTDPAASPTPTPAGFPSADLPGIDLYTFATPEAAAAAFRAGDLDAVGGLPPSAVAGLAGLPGVRRVVYPTTVLTAVIFNLRNTGSPFRDVRVRRAFLAAIDRPGIVATVLGGGGTPADVPIAPSSPFYDPGPTAPQRYDPAAAASLLSAAGWKLSGAVWNAPKGVVGARFDVLTLDAATNPTLNAVAKRVVADWASFGVAADLTGLGAAELFEGRLLPHEFDVAIIDMNLGSDPDLYPLLASGQAALGGTNLAGYQSAKLDKLLVAARAPADLETRVARFATLQASLLTELPFLSLYFAERVELVRDRLVGPVPRQIAFGSERYGDVLTWRLAGTPAP